MSKGHKLLLPHQDPDLIIMSCSSEPRATFILNNGRTLPKVGLGTFQGDQGNWQVKEIVSAAIKSGYRHIDCATAYGNEKEVGIAIEDSGIARNKLFITTKLSVMRYRPEYLPILR